MATMKAVRLHEYGGPENLKYEDAPVPEVGPGQLLVKVHATGVNPLDWKLRSGVMKDYWPLTLPTIFGSDIAGEVAAVGEGVTEFTVGDAVFGLGMGGYAEYTAVPASTFARKPETLTFVEAAAVPVGALTAYQALFEHAGLQVGQRVLVQAASGGVGLFGVQLAKIRGAYVIGTASGRNEAFVRSLGVDEFIDYTAGPFEEKVSDLDVVFDTVGAETATRALSVIKPGGALVVIAGGPSDEEAQKRNIRNYHFGAQGKGDQLAEIAGLIDAGKIKIEIDTVLPLTEAAKAQELSESRRARGKIVLQVI